MPRPSGLPWVTWRQHRFALTGVFVLLAAFGTLLVVNGLAMHTDYHRLGLDNCGSLTSPACHVPMQIFDQRYSGIAQFLPRILLFLPAALGMFVGAPLVARELETGTFRFVWTQGRSRVRWIMVKLAILAAVLTVMALAFSALYTWWFGPWVPVMGRMGSGQSYDVEGIVFAARTLFGFALGALLGAVIRRTVPAMAATAIGWLAVVVPSVIYLRPLIQSPVVSPASTADTSGAWTISSWIQDSAGHHLSDNQLNDLARQASPPGERIDFEAWLNGHGYTEWVKYQPNNRFWHFQIVEASAYVVLAMVLAGATVWWVRRRAT